MPKSAYGWYSYQWCMNGSSNQLCKYCNDSSYGYRGFTDNKTILDSEDDAASVHLGKGWRIPLNEELDELRNNCTWMWTTLFEVPGYRVTSNKSGYTNRWIFLPAAGSRSDYSLRGVGSAGIYWSSSLYPDYPFGAFLLSVSSSTFKGSYNFRSYGISVRPVTE